LGSDESHFLRADHVGDAHEVVVDDVGQVVGREAVALEQDLVVHLRALEADVAAQQVRTTIASSAGMARRTTWASPAALRRCASAGASVRQRPS
jgi:hypothetical protein